MNYTDEQLSAFLDAELPAPQMEAIRAALAEDEGLANRMAELARVDSLVAEYARGIDEQPLSPGLQRLLGENDSETTTAPKVVSLSLWKRAQQGMQRHMAMAAGVAMAFGFSLAQFLPLTGQGGEASQWQLVSNALDTLQSGQSRELANGRIQPRLSFTNQQGQYCRQFSLQRPAQRQETIACKDASDWRLTATVVIDQTGQIGAYQTASGGSLLDSALDQMMVKALDNDAERVAIAKQWQQQ